MKTYHKIIFSDSRQMENVPSGTVDLIVTSPPYPMIEMWDDLFSNQSAKIDMALKNQDGHLAFESMHRELDKVWEEAFRVLKPGGIACVNIGDAVRTINGRFALYTNHSMVLTRMQKIGFTALPAILWRKQTNAPSKFMGSGMMPPGAYVTLEHEYILILRKGDKREFNTEKEKKLRRESAFFWEERNLWFSDVWVDLKGASQSLFDDKIRQRSGAFPFELPYRLISMFSIKGDTVLDPFLGVGTTLHAAMAAGRSSIGYEIDRNFQDSILLKLSGVIAFSNRRIVHRLENHLNFVEEQFRRKGKFKYTSRHYLFPVMTGQETDLLINEPTAVNKTGEDTIEMLYSDQPQENFVGRHLEYVLTESEKEALKKRAVRKKDKKIIQRQLFE